MFKHVLKYGFGHFFVKAETLNLRTPNWVTFWCKGTCFCVRKTMPTKQSFAAHCTYWSTKYTFMHWISSPRMCAGRFRMCWCLLFRNIFSQALHIRAKWGHMWHVRTLCWRYTCERVEGIDFCPRVHHWVWSSQVIPNSSISKSPDMKTWNFGSGDQQVQRCLKPAQLNTWKCVTKTLKNKTAVEGK